MPATVSTPTSVLLGLVLSGSLALAARAELPSGDPAFVPPGARLERVVDGAAHDLVFTEGPVVTCDGRLLLTDITFGHARRGPRGGWRAGNILAFDPRSGVLSVFRSPSGMANGLALDLECNLLAAEGADRGGRRITRTDLSTGRAEIVVDSFRGRPLNSPNDLVVDAAGRIWFTDPRYVGHEPVEQDAMGVYRVDPDGGIERVLDDAGKPNGIALSPDGRTLYVGSFDDGGRPGGRRLAVRDRVMAIFAYPLDARGRPGARRTLVAFPGDEGPDGITVDEEGNLWVAVQSPRRPGIYAYDQAGVARARIPVPAPTNLAFGRGEDADLLWITAESGLWRIRVGKRGWHVAHRTGEPPASAGGPGPDDRLRRPPSPAGREG